MRADAVISSSELAHRGITRRVKVAIFRTDLVRKGEPFILEQPRQFLRYDALLVGARRLNEIDGIPIPRDAYVQAERGVLGGFWARALKYNGRSPQLLRFLRSAHVSLIHAHFGTEGARCLWLARRLRCPLVTTYHGFDVHRSEEHLKAGPRGERFYAEHRPALAARGDLHIAVSDYLRSRLLDLGFPAERVVRHYIGVDTQLFRPQLNDREEGMLLFVGRIAPNKGALDAVHVAAAVNQTRPCTLVMVGDGPLRGEVEEAARTARVKVVITGFLERRAVAEWMRRATVLVGPSRTFDGEREAFGLAYVEAQATGLPVAAYDTGGIPEAVVDGRTGALIPEGDVTGLAEAATTLVIDTATRRRFGAAGIQHVTSQFEIRQQGRRLESLYDEARASHDALRRAHARERDRASR